MKDLLKLAIIMPRIDQRDYFLYLFSLRYTVVIDHTDPDVVVYDDITRSTLPKYKHKPLMIAFTGESPAVDYSRCNFAMGFVGKDPDVDKDKSKAIDKQAKSIYLPLWVLFVDWFEHKHPDYCKLSDLVDRTHVDQKWLKDKERFAGFVASNPVGHRQRFVNALSHYKQVTCPGKVLNNCPPIGGRMGQSKELFLRQCKFTVAFENVSKPGYITEKILHAFQSRTVPIYWGTPDIVDYFNPRAFINCHDFSTWDEVIAEVIRVDRDIDLYLAMLNEPVFNNDQLPQQFLPLTVIKQVERYSHDFYLPV